MQDVCRVNLYASYAQSQMHVQSQLICKLHAGRMQASSRVKSYATYMQCEMHMQSQVRENTDEAKDLLAYLAACIFYISVSHGLVLRTVEGSAPRDCSEARPPTASLKEQYIVRKWLHSQVEVQRKSHTTPPILPFLARIIAWNEQETSHQRAPYFATLCRTRAK